MTTNLDAAPPPPIDQGSNWDEERWAAARDLLPALIETVPSDNAPVADRMRFIDFATTRARQVAASWPSDPPGEPARKFLAAMVEQDLRRPRAKADPKGPPQVVAGIARLLADIAQDPSAVDRLDQVFVPGLNLLLGRDLLNRYLTSIEASRETLAMDCESMMRDIPHAWRRTAGAPTREERELVARVKAEHGMDLA